MIHWPLGLIGTRPRAGASLTYSGPTCAMGSPTDAGLQANALAAAELKVAAENAPTAGRERRCGASRQA
jgi:hypothetical protein